MQLHKLTIKDKKLFGNFLSFHKHELSAYAFENIYIWKGLYQIYWAKILDSLCVFFKDKMGCFLYLAPLGKDREPEVVKEAFRVMNSFNQNKAISRIENIEEKDLSFYQALGYDCRYKFSDYLCKREDLVQLKGDRFKSKRACYNYFIKHYKAKYLPFSLKYNTDCLKLYQQWMQDRQAQNQEPVYQGMLADSRNALKILLVSPLDFIGRIVMIDSIMKAFTFGFRLNSDTFCILYEIADLSIKGLSQFIFRAFSRELKDFRFINIMDDSGLENLQRVKLSYHPARLAPAYIAQEKNG